MNLLQSVPETGTDADQEAEDSPTVQLYRRARQLTLKGSIFELSSLCWPGFTCSINGRRGTFVSWAMMSQVWRLAFREFGVTHEDITVGESPDGTELDIVYRLLLTHTRPFRGRSGQLVPPSGQQLAIPGRQALIVANGSIVSWTSIFPDGDPKRL